MSASRGKDEAAAGAYNGIVVVAHEKGAVWAGGWSGVKIQGTRVESRKPPWLGRPWGRSRAHRERPQAQLPLWVCPWVPSLTSLFSGSVRAEGEDCAVRCIKHLQYDLHQCLLGTQRWIGHIRDTVGLCLTSTSVRSQWVKFVTKQNSLSCHIWKNT